MILSHLQKLLSGVRQSKGLFSVATRNYAAKVKKDISKVNISLATPAEHDEILALTNEYYAKHEPHLVGAGVTIKEIEHSIDAGLRESLPLPFCVVARDEKGDMIAYSNNSIHKRSDFTPSQPLPNIDENHFMMPIYHELFNTFWKRADERGIHTVLHTDFCWTRPDYRGRKLIRRLILWSMKPELLEEYGIQGVFCEAGNWASSIALVKIGFSVWHDLDLADFKNEKGEQVYHPTDGSSRWWLLYMNKENILKRRRILNSEFY